MYANATASPEARQSHAERLNRTIQEHNERLHHVAARLHSLADRLYGERPSGVEKNAVSPVPNGALGAIEESFRSTEGAISRLNDACERLNDLA